MVPNTPKDTDLTRPSPAVEEELPESARNTEEAHPVDQGRVPPVPSRDEANIDTDEALPDDEEEQAIAENPEREEVRFGEAKPPRRD
ncbi:hypothetical protein J2Z31_001192 [Sinorhizobium kostiense]|uniref:Uncharacterized protein n=1 Tax=Sinorhizobium kostiense TaxID=76747 RepID=A0ABS4QVP0_9HYPH|nr:hypothetical protein [Sinorhizobium kostiense]MBP2234702.1 hypothetical protein [Sinorhizobium kostiense]